MDRQWYWNLWWKAKLEVDRPLSLCPILHIVHDMWCPWLSRSIHSRVDRNYKTSLYISLHSSHSISDVCRMVAVFHIHTSHIFLCVWSTADALGGRNQTLFRLRGGGRTKSIDIEGSTTTDTKTTIVLHAFVCVCIKQLWFVYDGGLFQIVLTA